MNNSFELAKIEGVVTVASIVYTIVDGIHDTVEYRLILSQGVNSEWRNLFQREWDRATAPTTTCPDYLKKMAQPRVSVGTRFIPAAISFVCVRTMFHEAGLLVKEIIDRATAAYLETLGVPSSTPSEKEETIQSEIMRFMEVITQPDKGESSDAEVPEATMEQDSQEANAGSEQQPSTSPDGPKE